jgi:hypothetical protein
MIPQTLASIGSVKVKLPQLEAGEFAYVKLQVPSLSLLNCFEFYICSHIVCSSNSSADRTKPKVSVQKSLPINALC